MTTRITVIGAGPGGYIAAIRAAQMGAVVTVIEKDNVGGTCLNWGCIPSKVLIITAELFERFHHADSFGIRVEGTVQTDMQRLMERKKSVIQTQTKGILSLFQHHKINYIQGTGVVEGPGRITVTTPQGESVPVAWDKLVLATGTKPLSIPGFTFDGEKILSSDHALNLDAVPESILIVGGGVIGCEFACLLSGLGANVTIVEALPRLLPLPSVDADCSKVLQREMKKRKIKFYLNRSVQSYREKNGKLCVTITPPPWMENVPEKDKKPIRIDVEKVLVCIGRQANSSDLGLERIDLQIDEKGWIDANNKMETSIDGVYAIGDILGPSKVMLAHVASMEGVVAADNAMGAERYMRYDAVPGAIFTSPEVAAVGLTEAQAREQGLNVKADRVLFRTIGKAQILGTIAGEVKMISDTNNGRILGVHMIGPHATDLIAEATLAVKLKAKVQDLAETIHAHPTLAEIMLETSLKALNQSLHG